MFVGLLTVALAVTFLLLLETRHEVEELSKQVAVLQRDMIEEFSYKYGGLYGKK